MQTHVWGHGEVYQDLSLSLPPPPLIFRPPSHTHRMRSASSSSCSSTRSIKTSLRNASKVSSARWVTHNFPPVSTGAIYLVFLPCHSKEFTVIFKQGDRPDGFYMIFSGTCTVHLSESAAEFKEVHEKIICAYLSYMFGGWSN
jgi:hypothetical protein